MVAQQPPSLVVCLKTEPNFQAHLTPAMIPIRILLASFFFGDIGEIEKLETNI
jgi:hypothetical protein